MKSLARLFWVKKFAQLRNLFGKPVSAIITVVCIGFFGFGLIPLLTTVGHNEMDDMGFSVIAWLTLGMLLVFFISLFLSRHKALFFLADSYYLFTGPFTNKQVLTCLLYDIGTSAILLTAVTFFIVLSFGVSYAMPPVVILTVLATSLLLSYVMTAVMDFIYLRQMVQEKKGKAFVLCVAVVVVLVAGLIGYYFVQQGFSLGAAWQALSNSVLFYVVPGFGWAKLGMDGIWQGNLLYAGLGFGLLVAACVAVSLALVRTKGYFYEQAMVDAENYTEYYQKAKEGKTDEAMMRKVRTAKVKNRSGAGAIFSKNWLLAKKQNFFRLQDVIIVAVYVVMAIFMNFGFIGLCAMLLVWLFIATSVSSLVEDLKHHYIYLVPASPFAKLAATLVVPIGKNTVLLIIAVAIGGIALGESLATLGMMVAIGFTFCVLLTMANVLSLRIMKSRNNLMVEQMLRMVVVVLAAAPALGILFVLIGMDVQLSILAILGIMGLCNVVVSAILLALCAPMMNGRELNSD